MNRRAGFTMVCLALVLTPGAEGRLGTRTVDPPQPTCTQEVRFDVSGWFPDGCFSVTDQTFVVQDNVFQFVVEAHDAWEHGVQCPLIVVSYGDEAVVGPLDPGLYYLSVREVVTSQRETGQIGWIPFEVECCAPLPDAVQDLRLDRLPDAGPIHLTWRDTVHADDYIVLESATPGGAFDNVVGAVAGGEDGLEVAAVGGDAYFLVAGRNTCGTGEKR